MSIQSSDRLYQYFVESSNAVCDLVKTTFGPSGLDTLVVDKTGSKTITSSGSTVVKFVSVDDPIASMIINVAESQEEIACDGTTISLLLTAELLSNAEELLSQGIHPSDIIRGYNLARTKAINSMRELSYTLNDEELQLLIEAAIDTSASRFDCDVFSDIVYDAVSQVYDDDCIDLDLVRITTDQGATVNNSELLNGVLLTEFVDVDFNKSLDNATIALLSNPLEPYNSSKEYILSGIVESEIIDQEERQYSSIISELIEKNIDIVLSTESVSAEMSRKMKMSDITLFDELRDNSLKMLKSTLKLRPIRDDGVLAGNYYGSGSITQKGPYPLISGPGDAVTIRIRSHNEHKKDAIERIVKNKLIMAANGTANQTGVTGGGAIEMELSNELMDYSTTVVGKKQLAIEGFADALEITPKILAYNSGVDPLDTLSALRNEHEANNIDAGFNAYSKQIENMRSAGAIDSLSVKETAIETATQLAIFLLGIDDILETQAAFPSKQTDIDQSPESFKEKLDRSKQW